MSSRPKPSCEKTGPTASAKVPQISHAALLTGAQVSRGLARLFFVLAVARQLGPQQFGVYTLLIATVEMVAVASGSGYADYLTREAAKDAYVGWGLWRQLTWLRFLCLLPLTFVGLGIFWALRYPRIALIGLAWLMSSLIPRSVTENAQGVLRGIAHYWAYFGVELAFDASIACALLIFLLHGSRLNAVIAAEVIAAWAAAAVSMVFVLMFRIEERARLSPRQLLEKSVIFNLYAFMSNLYDRLDVVLLSKLAGDYATGIYGAAYRPLGTLQLVPYGVLYSLLPTLSRNAGGKDERLRLEKAMGFLLSAGFALVLAITIFARPALTLVLGARWADSARALKILIWAVLLRYVNYALNVRLFAGGHESVFVATSTVCLAVNVAGNLILIPKYSWRAAAVMTIVTELILLMQNTYWLRRRVGAIPMPLGWARTSLVFAALMIASLAGSRIFPPQAIGTCCVLCFLAYVYRTGLVGEFAGAWGARQAVG